MSSATATPDRKAERDAAVGAAVAVGCGLAFLLMVALPLHAGVRVLEAGPMGFVLGAVLAPVAAGLAAYVSAATLRTRSPGLTRRARRLHAGTIALTTVVLVGYLASSAALRGWLD